MSEPRIAEFKRNSKETKITCKVNVDGTGKSKIKTKIDFLDHMLDLFTFHGFFDIELDVEEADLDIDIHHTNEDIGIVLGKTFKKALGDEKAGIKRFGVGFSPMESTLGKSVVDISGRGYLTLRLDEGKVFTDSEGYSMAYLEHFLESFAHSLGATINVKIEDVVEDTHTNIETVFKSLGLAMDQATTRDPRRGEECPSTKGIID